MDKIEALTREVSEHSKVIEGHEKKFELITQYIELSSKEISSLQGELVCQAKLNGFLFGTLSALLGSFETVFTGWAEEQLSGDHELTDTFRSQLQGLLSGLSKTTDSQVIAQLLDGGKLAHK